LALKDNLSGHWHLRGADCLKTKVIGILMCLKRSCIFWPLLQCKNVLKLFIYLFFPVLIEFSVPIFWIFTAWNMLTSLYDHFYILLFCCCGHYCFWVSEGKILHAFSDSIDHARVLQFHNGAHHFCSLFYLLSCKEHESTGAIPHWPCALGA